MSETRQLIDPEFIDTLEAIRSLVDGIATLNAMHRTAWPLLYINIERQSLGPGGELNLFTILVDNATNFRRSYIIDIGRLANTAFSTSGTYGASLRSILGSDFYKKAFFDVRFDSHALYTQYGIKLKGVCDVQLMENAFRPTAADREHLRLLENYIDERISGALRQRWLVTKHNGEWQYDPRKGGSYAVFKSRPISNRIRAYCYRNIQFMPQLYQHFSRDSLAWMSMISGETERRIRETQKDGYDPLAEGRFRSPWTAEQNKLLDSLAEESDDTSEDAGSMEMDSLEVVLEKGDSTKPKVIPENGDSTKAQETSRNDYSGEAAMLRALNKKARRQKKIEQRRCRWELS
ncbi:hypothetical protein IL306_009221 [Fusarium sp. DS 682]|nr:hypothetical protein IL306_009221 [Fusarium sp. DS 682]